MQKENRCLSLFVAFFKIGLFTFGGGYAMISMIMSEICEKRGWIDADELSDVVAIAESTPGPIAINSATYIGYKRAGVKGSACATLGVVLPSFIIIYLISLCIDWFMGFRAVQSAFQGIRCAVAILILRAGFKLVKNLKKDVFAHIICLIALALVLLIDFGALSFSTLWLIAAGAVIGLVTMALRKTKEGEGNA